ncbi:putative ribonuclease H-like domain-containing protein [Tanacetum coccineum]
MDRKSLGLTRSWFSATNVHKRVTLLGSAEQKLVKTAKGTQHTRLRMQERRQMILKLCDFSDLLLSISKFIEDAYADVGALKIYGMMCKYAENPSHAGHKFARGDTLFQRKPCVCVDVCPNLLKDYDFNEKRMAKKSIGQTDWKDQLGWSTLSSNRPNLSTPDSYTGRQNLSKTSDNGTEFKNRDLIEFCGSKGIKRDYINARTPQQNGVAERKNRTLIEAARTMLADSSLPTIYLKPFGCHVTILNTIDQLGKFDGKSDEDFLVGYSTQGKAYRVYNLASKRVEETLNVKFLKNKPNVAQIGFAWYFDLDYLTDSMDYSRVRSTNPSAGPSNATTNNAGSQDTNDSDTDDDQDVIILPSYPSNAISSPSQMAPQDSSSVKSHSLPVVEGTQAEKEELASLERQEHEANAEAERLGLEFAHAAKDLVFSAAKSFQTPSTNVVTPVTPLTPGTPVTPASAPFATSTSPDILSAGASSLRYPYPSTFANEFAIGIPILKDIYDNPGSGMFTSSSYDDEEPRADLTNMSSTENVNPTSTKRVKSAHPSSLIIGDIASPVQNRSRVNKSSNGEIALVCYIKDQRRNNHTDFHHCLFACFLSQTEPRSVAQALEDPSWVEAMQEEMQQFQFQNVWILVDLPPGKRAIGTKWILKNKKDARGIIIRNKARLVAQGHIQAYLLNYIIHELHI